MTISWPLYPPREPRYPVYTILDGPQSRSSRIWISENLVFPPGLQLRTVQAVTSDYRLRPPAPAHMPAYFRTVDPNTVRGRRYWSRYWNWRSLEPTLITRKISTVMVCGSLRLNVLRKFRVECLARNTVLGQVSWFHNSEVRSGKHSRSCHVCPYHHHHIFSAYNLCNRNFFL